MRVLWGASVSSTVTPQRPTPSADPGLHFFSASSQNPPTPSEAEITGLVRGGEGTGALSGAQK